MRQRELCGQRFWNGRNNGTFWNTDSKEKVMGEAAREKKDRQGLAGPHKDSNFIPK